MCNNVAHVFDFGEDRQDIICYSQHQVLLHSLATVIVTTKKGSQMVSDAALSHAALQKFVFTSDSRCFTKI